MKVLIWQSYGSVRVYSTSEKSFENAKFRVHDLFGERGYDSDALFEVSNTQDWRDLEDVVSAWTQGDEAFDKFGLCEVEDFND